jgi:hypothetical protein
MSGIGVISGWKCEAVGDITVSFDDGDPIPLVYGSARGDTGVSAVCNDDGLNGFVAIWNWGLLSDGEHTAVVYDNDMEFARSTFSVATLGEEFVVGAAGECTIPNFPSTGESATFAWNGGTNRPNTWNSSRRSWSPWTEIMGPGLAQFDGTWTASLDTMGASCATLPPFSPGGPGDHGARSGTV